MAAERDLVARVIQLANLLVRRLGPLFEKWKITPQQWLVLSAIAAEETPISLVALARRLSVTKQNMTGMMARLEQLGLAERQGDPADLRSSRVQLTRKGKALVERIRPSWQAWLASLGEGELSEREMQLFTRNVERLIASLDRSP